jgi:polysaccharide export outer membrane protein
MSAWECISLAGGFNTDADQENILLVRGENGKTVIKAVNLKIILSGETLVQDIYLQNGDVVYVLPTAIADVQRFMTRLYNILSPIIGIESAIVLFPEARDILLGKENTQTGVIVPR